MIISESSESFDRVTEVIKAGGIIAFRTDTLYGLGADPFNASAVAIGPQAMLIKRNEAMVEPSF